MNRGIYKFRWDSRGGTLSGIFTATSEEIEGLIGTEVYFGEVLGKHSEVYGTVEAEEIKLVTDEPNAVAIFEKFEMHTGYNPLGYIGDDENDEEE